LDIGDNMDIEQTKEEYKETMKEVETIELMKWDTIRDVFYAFKRWFGFKFLGWFKPKGYDYGYFIDPLTVSCKYRDDNRIIHTFIQTFSEKDGIDIIKK
jgi:hypothetical protein